MNAGQLAMVALSIEKYEAEKAKARSGTRSDLGILIPQGDAGRASEKPGKIATFLVDTSIDVC